MGESDPILEALSTAFGALGRVLVCLDPRLDIVNASPLLDATLGPGAAEQIVGRPVGELLEEELFAPGGSLREALLAGERREGWRGHLRGPDGESHLVSLTVAPVEHPPGSACDPRVRYLLVLRPDEEDFLEGPRGPTSLSGLIARSPAMLRLFDLIRSLRHSEATVLLTGESGTGKEVAARAIHQHSPRSSGPFVAVNCAALPGDLLESELFGHVKGAFTGAIRDRIGRFEAANGGTLFLDEIGDLPLLLQAKLLRVLQERTFERLGQSRSLPTDARILAATNRDLPEAVRTGSFREDLYYRLRVVPIELPPLRERREDVEALARSLLARIGQRRNRLLRLSPSALEALLGHAWPGNVRELENALEYAFAICQGQTILPEHLPAELRAARAGGVRSAGLETPSRGASRAPSELAAEASPDEAARLRQALEQHQWRRDAAAVALGMSRTTLWRKMREHRLLRWP